MKHKLNYKGPYKAYSHTQFQSFTDNSSKQHQQQQQDQHCIVLGTDFKSPGQVKAEKNLKSTNQCTNFLEWPLKNTDTWLDLASNSRIPAGNFTSLACISFFFFFFK